MSIMGRSCTLLFNKAWFGAVVVVGFILILLIGTLESGGNREKMEEKLTATFSSMEVLDREKFFDPKSDLNYTSKRRVPNGPDPIHNRCVRWDLKFGCITFPFMVKTCMHIYYVV